MSFSLNFKPCYSIFSLVFLVFILNPVSAFSDQDINIDDAPDWIIDNKLNTVANIPIDEISDGIFYRLVDKQIQVTETGERTSYSRFVETIANKKGLKSESQLNLEFDPSYQKLVLNSLFVLRDGKRFDRLSSARMSLINRESELENQIYSGTLTLNILISDLQVGDTLDYSYSIYGANPVYQDIFSYSTYINWSVPVYDQYIRVLWGKSKPLYVNTRNSNVSITQNKKNNFVEYLLTIHNAETIERASQIPSWYSPYASIHFNETEQWSDVIDWALPLYSFDSIHPSIQQVANKIKGKHEDQSDQIVAALKYTQEKVRYVGLEMGENSHLPTAPEKTLALKYGDCKDKAVLLIAILKALGIQASPAFVDTDNTKLLAELPPGVNLFNHVIVTLVRDHKRIWLDPTLMDQDGNLANIFQPNYGYALVLVEGENILTSMEKQQPTSYVKIIEEYFIPEKHEQKVPFTVTTKHLGYGAILLHDQILRNGKQQVSNDYKIYYQGTYPSLISEADIDITSNETSGVISTFEQYSILDFWGKKDKDYEVDFYPDDILNAVFKPEQINRNAPLDFSYPNHINVLSKIKFESDGWDFNPEDFEEDNPFFRFTSKVEFKNNTLSINYDYQSKTDHIASDQIDLYLAARDRLQEAAYYGIVKYDQTAEIGTVADKQTVLQDNLDGLFWFKVIAIVYIVGLLFIIVSWRLESKKRPQINTENFYSISLFKFLVLSISTMGCYDAYWMYRNWKVIKTKTNSTMMPIARGVFCYFWFYPLFNALKADSLKRYEKNKVMPPILAAFLALVYIIVSLVFREFENIYISVGYLFIPILFIPFINYLHLLDAKEGAIYKYNAKWHLRHIVAVILSVPILVYSIADETPFLPGDSVRTESQMLSSDLQYLYRQKVLPANETILYFYSDALFSVRKDGNGLTEHRVFSYWLDEQGDFHKQSVIFESIKNVSIKYSKKEDDNTIITITKFDGSDFLLFVSIIDGGDHTFVNELQKRWKAK